MVLVTSTFLYFYPGVKKNTNVINTFYKTYITLLIYLTSSTIALLFLNKVLNLKIFSFSGLLCYFM